MNDIGVDTSHPRKLREDSLMPQVLKLVQARSLFKGGSDLESRWRTRQGRGILALTSAHLSLPTIPGDSVGASRSPWSSAGPNAEHTVRHKARPGQELLVRKEVFQAALNKPISGCHHESVALLACSEIY